MSDTLNKNFLDTYRELESELKYLEKSVLEYENTLEPLELERLKVCRIMRNYIVHNDTKFLNVSNNQINFIKKLVKNLQLKSKTVKDIAKKIPIQSDKILLKDLVVLIDKYNVVPIEYKKEIFIIDKNILIHQLAIGNKKLDFRFKSVSHEKINKSCKSDNLSKELYVVLDDKNNYFGIIDLRKGE